jgi:hypothetical protein
MCVKVITSVYTNATLPFVTTELHEWTLISTALHCDVDKEINHISDEERVPLLAGSEESCDTNVINALRHSKS